MRPIDADALLDKLKLYVNGSVIGMIEQAPTIDAVSVVGCKDCKFSEVFQNDSSGVMTRYCDAFTLKRKVADDDFCSYGERKDDDNAE